MLVEREFRSCDHFGGTEVTELAGRLLVPGRLEGDALALAAAYPVAVGSGIASLMLGGSAVSGGAAQLSAAFTVASGSFELLSSSGLASAALSNSNQTLTLTGSLAHGIGLSLHEAPDLAPGKAGAMVAEGTYSLTVGLSKGKSQHAFASAMIALTDGNTEVLWKSL